MIRKYHNQKPQTELHGTARKSCSTITRHQEDKLGKATISLFPIKMIRIIHTQIYIGQELISNMGLNTVFRSVIQLIGNRKKVFLRLIKKVFSNLAIYIYHIQNDMLDQGAVGVGWESVEMLIMKTNYYKNSSRH